jgi:hypothetical protein
MDNLWGFYPPETGPGVEAAARFQLVSISAGQHFSEKQ